MTKWIMPTFSVNFQVASPDGEFVSILSSPSVPSCTSRGTGTEVGKLVQTQINTNADDGSWKYTGAFDADNVIFGSITPVS